MKKPKQKEEEEKRYIVKCCKCQKEHTIGDTVRYTSNYQVYCEDDCSDNVRTEGKTILEDCWWNYDD
jgi:hypothetical protein